MYIGRRDPEVQIIVPQNVCDTYTAKDGRSFIEIFVPPENIFEYNMNSYTSWGSMMVMPHQVDALRKGTPYNSVRVNDGAQIVCSVKDVHHNVIGSETLLPEDIIGRYLKYYRFLLYVDTCFTNDCVDDLNTKSFDLYLDMLHLGQTMEFYMNRLPRHI